MNYWKKIVSYLRLTPHIKKEGLRFTKNRVTHYVRNTNSVEMVYFIDDRGSHNLHVNYLDAGFKINLDWRRWQAEGPFRSYVVDMLRVFSLAISNREKTLFTVSQLSRSGLEYFCSLFSNLSKSEFLELMVRMDREVTDRRLMYFVEHDIFRIARDRGFGNEAENTLARVRKNREARSQLL